MCHGVSCIVYLWFIYPNVFLCLVVHICDSRNQSCEGFRKGVGKRFLALEQVIAEIKGKQSEGLALLPEILPEPGGADENQFLDAAYPE